MNNKLSKEAKKVLETIERYGSVRAVELTRILKVSTKTIYKHLNKLLAEELIVKKGSTPKVFYFIKEKHNENVLIDGFDINDQIIERNYIYISASGRINRGLSGLCEWCQKNNFNIEEAKEEYVKNLKAIEKFKKSGLISAKKTILANKHILYLDNIF